MKGLLIKILIIFPKIIDKIGKMNAMHQLKSLKNSTIHHSFRIGKNTFLLLSKEARITIKEGVVMKDNNAIRIRKNGSDGGHKGMKSLISVLKSTEFPRIRIGINKNYVHGSGDLANYVLAPFTEEELYELYIVLDVVCQAIDYILDGKIEEAMNKFNGKNFLENGQ